MQKLTIARIKPGNVMALPLLLTLSVFTNSVSAEATDSSLAVKNSDKIAFLGDSNTKNGEHREICIPNER